jgi:pyruvate dehydrogenase E1 component alpha subunit
MIKSPYSLKKNFSKLKKFNNNFLIRIYKNLYLCRSVEELIKTFYPENKMKTPTHLGIGQEAISVGLSLNLNANDRIFCHHRSHLPFMAIGGNIYKLFCELMGKKNGTSGGKGGSVHLCSNKGVHFASTAILGQSLGLAVGASLAFKIKNKKNISVAIFGNASLEEGVAYEVLNFASLKKIPTLFIYENNFYSIEMPNYKGYLKQINYKKIISSLKIKYLKVDGNNVADVYLKISQAIKYIKKKTRPIFIEFLTYRWLEHCGPFYDYDLKRNYRSKDEIDHWKKACPVKNFRNFLVKKVKPKKIEDIEKKINKSINLNFQDALNSKTPNKTDLLKNV